MCNRPFDFIEEMDETLISNWNNRVKNNDTKADYWPLLASKDNILNASVDINKFMPVTFEELLENNRKFKKLNMS